jgi:2-polyprenyl-6-methoxyphenol hydroxylase-like FAD-dependent oxidoreductase
MEQPLALENTEYDAIIVGGRPAGASLALRLGAAGLRVLILDHAQFPSRPAVSAPFVLPHALALLDELELDEREYAHNTPVLSRFVLEYGDEFRTEVCFDEDIAGRHYFYAVDRAQLDACLWRALARYPNVHALSGAEVLDVGRNEAGRVSCVHVKHGEREPQTFHGKCVIGADGRGSTIARAVGAPVLEERRDLQTTLYYAHWADVPEYAPGYDASAHIHCSLDGFSCAFMPTTSGETIVAVQGRSDRYLALSGGPQVVYEQILQARPRAGRRLLGARQVSALNGIERTQSLFRKPCGPGWALVGDAYVQKDALDAQGVYDALLGAKRLSQALIAWHYGKSWDEALAGYERAIWDALKPMFDATLQRVERELFKTPSQLVTRTLLRYVLTNPAYSRRFAQVVTGRADPRRLLPPSVMLGLAAGGALQRIRHRVLSHGLFDPTDPLQV